jgi:glycosyltransferase involved in cell wall biosynthesis
MRENETEVSPYISVIVPVRNSAKTIGDLLESLMNLEYDQSRLEIVVVDGNSSDGTRKIVEEYPVRLVDEEGKGLNAARNTGVKWSTGEIVAYTDGDCVVPPEWARSIARNFRSPFVGFVGGNVEGYDKGNFLSIYMDETFFQAKPSFKWRKVDNRLTLFQFPAGCNMAFRRDALAKINYFDERIEYGFDDLVPVEEVGNTGFRIILDPEVYVYHQHRTHLGEMLLQHFNYGRGGAKLMRAKRRESKLAQWFTTYLISSTFSLAFTSALLILGLLLRQQVLLEIALGGLTFFYSVLTVLYLETALRTRSLRKMLFYPILDITRGVVFTLGGLTQLIRERKKAEESEPLELKYKLELPQDVYPIINLGRWVDERSLF